MESAFSGAELQSTLYHTEPAIRQADGNTGEPMFAFAVKVSSDTAKNIKVRWLKCKEEFNSTTDPLSFVW